MCMSLQSGIFHPRESCTGAVWDFQSPPSMNWDPPELKVGAENSAWLLCKTTIGGNTLSLKCIDQMIPNYPFFSGAQ